MSNQTFSALFKAQIEMETIRRMNPNSEMENFLNNWVDAIQGAMNEATKEERNAKNESDRSDGRS